jgi:Holliday junction resolvasome RuvABC ATP-dependent DNA helicase subunit
METIKRLSDFIGQERLKAALVARIEKAHEGQTALPHLLLSAAAEAGKRSLATAGAGELGVDITVCRADELVKPLDLTGLLSQLGNRQILVVDGVENLDARLTALLCEAISDFRLAIKIGERIHTLPLPQFTFVGLTTRLSRVDQTIRRWCVMYEFDPYTSQEIGAILSRFASDAGIQISPNAASQLAVHCGTCPGNAAVLIRRIERQYGQNAIHDKDVPTILAELGYDEHYPQSLQLQDALIAMDGREFEHWAASMFRREGYSVHITDASGDHGIDLILSRDGRTSAVQCKRWTDPVGEPVLRDFYGAIVSAGISSGIVVTTSEFTASAKSFAQGKPIRLIEMDELLLSGALDLTTKGQP